MIVKIRFPEGRRLQARRGTNRELCSAFGALLVPASLMAYSLGFWRLASDLGLAGQFDITGTFSHWQVWIGLGVILHASSIVLSRYGRGGELELPHVLTASLGRPDTEELEAHVHAANKN
ncbi:MAG TPA: hypothetical protein VGQ49_17800 [Bryobacteraceae bacterium]|jgi:hypothetical protein|nr:hypothetical protein [Bryobacteraceae bacterium]